MEIAFATGVIRPSPSREPAPRQPGPPARHDPSERDAETLSNRAVEGRGLVAGRLLSRPSPGAGDAARLSSAPPSVGRAIGSSATALPTDVRSDMEQKFGHDFARVRVHAGSEAGASAAALGAEAYTVGNDIVFAPGRFAPSTAAGSRLLAHELAHVVQGRADVVRPYRPATAFNFGVADDATLKEDSFSVKAGDKDTKPWIQKVEVKFATKTTDADGSRYWKGSATASYSANTAREGDLTFQIAGGSRQLGLTDKGDFTVQRIEGLGYNSGTFSGAAGVDFDPAEREGPNKRYTKKDASGDRPANMSFAVFYNKGEALHAGPVDASSHGCVHVDWNSMDTAKRLNYHSVIGLTKVSVSYP